MLNLFKKKPETQSDPEPFAPAVPAKPKDPKTRADIACTAFDNEHVLGIQCTLSFADGTEASAAVPSTGNLAKDQADAAARALQIANTRQEIPMDDPTVANQFEPTGASPAAGPTKTVCIEMTADGTFMVGLEKPEAEPMTGGGADMEGMEGMPPGGAEEPEKSNMKPAASIDEALEMARGLLEGDESGEMTVEQAFQGGFNGEPMPGKSGY